MTEWNDERPSIVDAEMDATIPRQSSPISASERRLLFGILFGGPVILIVIVLLAR